MNIGEAILKRTSYRGNFTEEAVSKEDLQLLMQAGLAAPSGCNKQTTSLIGVDNKELLKKISVLVELPFVHTAPAMICVLTERIFAYRDKCYSVQDYSAAIQNMLLLAVELGYESCWIEGQITDEDNIGRKIADLLGVPEKMELVCILPIGKAAQNTMQPRKKPFNARAYFNFYGGK